MSFGLPVIATPVGGIPDFVHAGENGLLVPPGDVDALARAITTLGQDPGLRARLGTSARSLVQEQVRSAALAVQWREAYRQAVR
jgi:glycosyltransferase involved in cell wall biosynthesis